MLKNKRGAIELSMSTVVIVVLSMILLIGGIVLVQKILSGGNEIIEVNNNNIMTKLSELYSEKEPITLLLGASKVAEIKADGKPVNVGFGSSTSDGDGDIGEMEYTLSLDTYSSKNCVEILGGEEKVGEFINKDLNTPIGYWDNYDGSGNVGAIIEFIVPEGTKRCTQKIQISVNDGTVSRGGNSFTLKIV
jgi:hypothetical protein